MTGLFRYGRLPGYTPHCTAQSCPPRYPRSFAMKRLSAVFSARMGAVLASAALLSGCVVMPVEGGYRHHDRYEHYESHDRYDRYEGHHAHRYGHPPPPRAERRPRPPGPGYAWSQGRWVWSGQRYHWQPGRWHYVRPAPPPHVRPGPPPHAHRPGPPPHAQHPPRGHRAPAPPSARPERPHGHVPRPGQHQDPRRFFPRDPTPREPYRDRGPGGA